MYRISLNNRSEAIIIFFAQKGGDFSRKAIFSNIAHWKSCPKYSGTPPYDHLVYKTTSLLRPYSFKPNVKTIESFYYFEDPVNATTSL